MSDPEKPKFHPGATIQISVDQVQLLDPDAGTDGEAARGRRTAPPPLPPNTIPAPARVSASPVAVPQGARKDTKLALHIGAVLAAVVVAIVAALIVAWRVRAGSAEQAAPASSSTARATGAAGSGSKPASSAVLTIPPIEVR